MIEDIVVPKWGLTADELTLVEWLCKVGDAVDKDQALAVLETDKADGELPSPSDGVIEELLASADEVVEPGQVVARLRKT